MANLDVLTKDETEKSFLDQRLPFTDMQNRELRATPMRWNNVVQEFAHKQLTFQTDRLAAIAGIAKRFRSSFQANYLAVIWESTIPYELFWIAAVRYDSSPKPRPGNCIAPSWS